MSKVEMKFDGETLLKGLNTLKEIKSMRDVSNITHSQFPGTHCPLMGALLVVRGIKDSLAFVVGTDECVYYSKSMTMAFDGFGGLKGRCVSVRLDTNDVTFGSAEKVERAFKEIVDEYKPSCVFLISTCVIEIIGDDFDALATTFQKEYNIPVLPVHTEHFKCEDHLPGIERALSACADLMVKQDTHPSVNILGQRHGDFTKSELYKVLNKENIEINIQLPKECTLDEIKTATKASLNIVVNDTALDLAKRMYEKFGTPYINFKKSCSHETNLTLYKELFSQFGQEVPAYIIEHYEKCKNLYNENTETYKGLRYIYGGVPFSPFESLKILTDLGLEPLLLQISDVQADDYDNINEITKLYNPYVTRTANVAGMTYVYDNLKPDLNFGPAYMHTLIEKKIAPVRFDSASDMIGFELCEEFFRGLANAKVQVEKYREEK